MLGFMEYVQNAFFESSHWNRDNQYSSLTATSRAILAFDTPKGLRLNVSSLSAPNFATSYTLSSVGVVDGSISYLYSSLPLNQRSKSSEIELSRIIEGYRHLRELRRADEPWWWEIWHGGRRVDRKNTLLYGRLFLPQSTLEALYLRRLSPTRQLQISCVSDSSLNNGGTILALMQNDYGKYSTEYLYSTDSALFGVRGLYNFGPDPRKATQAPSEGGESLTTPLVAEPLYGRFSAGAELYYGVLNKSGGMSTGLRFTTLPQHTGFPYTMTLTVNPLMGNLSSTYAVKAGRNLALCSKFDFNVYSYESDLQVGCELWRRRQQRAGPLTSEGDGLGESAEETLHVPELRGTTGASASSPATTLTTRAGRLSDDVSGVLKARVDQSWNIGVLWEGRIKDLLFSVGCGVDLRRRDQIIRAVGIELQYSS